MFKEEGEEKDEDQNILVDEESEEEKHFESIFITHILFKISLVS